MAPDSLDDAPAVPDLGAPPRRLTVTTGTVRQLVAEQFPAWAGLPVEPVARPGWDNRTFHLGDEMLVRLPSAAEYALAVEKEQRWLPLLAPLLPVPIPSVCGLGVPGAGYPFAWSVYRWLDGTPATDAVVDDPVRLAGELAGFLLALRAVDPASGPRPGVHNWHRGGTLRTYDATARRSLAALRDHLDTGTAAAATGAWAAALAAPWVGGDTWFHGDLAAGNLLLRDGQLAAVIDFGTCGVGDPSCDLAVAWTLLDAAGRRDFRERLGVDDASWARGRGWALWKTLAELASAVGDLDGDADGDGEPEVARLTRVLEEIVADDAGSARD